MDVLLYATKNPRNLGSIVRTSVEFGLSRIHLYDKFSLLENKNDLSMVEKVCRRDRLDRLDIITVDDPEYFVSSYEHSYATALTKRSGKIGLDDKVRFEEDSLIIFGNEACGIPRTISRRHEVTNVSIPNFGAENCLSLPIAYGIFIYEYLRQHPERFPSYSSK